MKKARLIKGITASSGSTRGRVRILKSPQEIELMEEGEILVIEMTSPVYVPAIKKAAAIITDIGGITCHAAIISRELGIPCIVGTRVATKVLKNGDLVEVDANNGIIKLLSK